MIELEFKVNKKEITKKILNLIKTADEISIQITYFLMPTKFVINGEDLFYDKKRKKTDEWYEMPLIDWSTNILGIIKNLPIKKKDKYVFSHESYRNIEFEMINTKKVKLIYTGTMKEFIVNYDELLNVFEIFEKKVKKFLNEYVPQLREHPYWGAWVKGEAEWEDEKGLVPIK